LAGLAYAVLVYRRREMRVPRWPWLAGLRGAAIATVLLLLMDFELPGTGEPLPEWLVLDVSPSMAFSGGIEAAGAPVTSRPAGQSTITFGAPVRVVSPDTPWDAIPDAVDSRLAPAIVRALETGASRLTVITDLRISDPVETAATLRSASVPVEVIDVGGALVNAGVSALELPATAPADEDIEGTVALFAEGVDSVRLTLRRDGSEGPVLLDTLVFPGVGAGDGGRTDRESWSRERGGPP
jgi:hypothetical protein